MQKDKYKTDLNDIVKFLLRIGFATIIIKENLKLLIP